MKYTIDTGIAGKNNLSACEVFLSMAIKLNPDLNSVVSGLKDKGYITEFEKEYFLSNKCNSIMIDILLDSETTKEQETRLLNIAKQLIKLYPVGIKPGTNYQWRGSEAFIVKRLKMLEKVYGLKLEENACIDATKRYIASFNGDLSYMQLLKYFIIKDDESQLASFLENTEGETKSKFNQEISELVV